MLGKGLVERFSVRSRDMVRDRVRFGIRDRLWVREMVKDKG